MNGGSGFSEVFVVASEVEALNIGFSLIIEYAQVCD